MNHNDRTNFIKVYSGEYWKCSLIQQLLLEHEIPSLLRNEFMGIIEPFAVVAGGANPLSIEVSSNNYELALSLIKESNHAIPEEE